MTNWLTTRDAVKRAAGINGTTHNARLDACISAASTEITLLTRRAFIPATETRVFRWPQRQTHRANELVLDKDLISVTTLKTKAQDSSPTTISASDFFLEPNNYGPPYHTIEIDLSSTASLEAGDSEQRTIEVVGQWGWSAETTTAGTVASGLSADATATSMVSSNASLVDVGATLLIGSEQVFISNQTFAARGSILLDGAVTADRSDVSITVDGSHGIAAGEVIMVGSEKMYVNEVVGNVLSVQRAYDGTTLAAHLNNAAVSINRTLTITRGVNGTTAATHADDSAVTTYVVPADIKRLALALSVVEYHQQGAGYARSIGQGEAAVEYTGRAVAVMKTETVDRYLRVREAAI